MVRRLNIVGAGKAGRTLGCLWARHGVFEIQDVLTTRAASAHAAVEFIGCGRATTAMADLQPAEAWMLSTPDDAIPGVCAVLAASRRLRAEDIVFQCSGSQPSGALIPAKMQGAGVASVHPVKSMADPAMAVATFGGTWCGAEGDARALEVLVPAFEAIGGRVFRIDPDSKAIYHSASVFVCNYLVALLEVGTRCYEKAGVQRAIANQVMEPLVRETLDNVFRLGLRDALTGPIARGDVEVVARQLEALEAWSPRIAGVYRALGAVATDLARGRESVAMDNLDRIEKTFLKENR